MVKKTGYSELEQQVKELEGSRLQFQRLEKEFQESEARYQRMIEAVTSYIYTVKVENGHPVGTTHRDPCEAVTGYTTKDFYSDSYLWIKMVPVEDHQIVNDQASCLLSGDSPKTIEHRIIKKDGTIRWVSNTPVPHYDINGQLVSYDGLIRDITERKLVEREKERLIAELQNALDEIKTLRGIIPICGYCKKIRDDEGFWNQLETYIHEHSEAKFSHGICPDCARKHYPDFFVEEGK